MFRKKIWRKFSLKISKCFVGIHKATFFPQNNMLIIKQLLKHILRSADIMVSGEPRPSTNEPMSWKTQVMDLPSGHSHSQWLGQLNQNSPTQSPMGPLSNAWPLFQSKLNFEVIYLSKLSQVNQVVSYHTWKAKTSFLWHLSPNSSYELLVQHHLAGHLYKFCIHSPRIVSEVRQEFCRDENH